MKKHLALLLVVAMALTAMLGLTSIASAEETAATPSQEIALFNISIKVGPTLLMAVPADGYVVNNDGTVDNLELLVWEQGKSNGQYTRLDAEKNGTILKSSGKTSVGSQEYIVFSYEGLAASQMFESVYVRTLYTKPDGFRSYSQIYEYSVAEYANGYLNSDKAHKPLVESLIDYGYYATEYYKGTDKASPAVARTSATVKAFKKVTVEYYLNGAYVGKDAQLVKNGGDTTLASPVVLEAKGAAPVWSDNAEGGVVNTKENITVQADFTSYSVKATFNTTTSGNTITNAVGSYVSATYENNKPNKVDSANTIVAPPENAEDGKTYKMNIGSFNLGNNFNYAEHHAYSYAKLLVCGDENNQYIRFSHNGAAENKFSPAFVASSGATGVGDTMGFSFSVDLMSGKDGTFPVSNFQIDRHGDGVKQDKGGSPVLINLNADGSVTLGGAKTVNYNGINTNVIAESISQEEFERVTVVVDFARGLYFGYLDGELKAVTNLHALFKGDILIKSIENLTNTRFLVKVYGGFNASNWSGSTATLNAAKAATVELNGVVTNLYDAETDTWNPKAIEKYVDENYYFYYDNATVYYGALYND